MFKQSCFLVGACIFLLYAAVMESAALDNNEGSRDIPRVLNYQGYLVDASGVPITDPSLSITFTIYDALSGGNVKWTETQASVDVDKGVFSVILGSTTAIPDSVFTGGTERWLELTVGGQSLSPRTRITSGGYAYTSMYADTAEFARNCINDNDWTRGTPDSVLFTYNRLGIARGNALNVLYGTNVFTHTNLGGYACTTGVDGMSYSYAGIGGGFGNAAAQTYTTIAGGAYNRADGFVSTIAGGYNNAAGGYGAAIGGGRDNGSFGSYSYVGGGRYNDVASNYGAIIGGYADSIAASAHYSYLFGINSNLTQDSTFMVHLPHIRFGDEATGYEFPGSDGTTGEVLTTDGSGQLTWSDIPSTSHWNVTDSALFTNSRWGVARGNAGNELYGTGVYSHTNFGAWACTTGTSGSDMLYATVTGGSGNAAFSTYAVVSGGNKNRASTQCFVGGGANNLAGDVSSTIGGGSLNTVNTRYGGILAGNTNTAGNVWYDTAAVVVGGWNNSALAKYSVVGAGKGNYVDGDYSVIIGGYMDTVTATGDYGYLFGINSNLTQDSTFMVDMPHIRFGSEADGYEVPSIDGSSGQVLTTNGSGQATWDDIPDDNDWVISGSNQYSAVSGNVGIGRSSPSEKLDVNGTVQTTGFKLTTGATNGYVLTSDASGAGTWQPVVSGSDDDWERGTPDSVLFTFNYVGVARGGAGNMLYGDVYGHSNFGVDCTTGVNGYSNNYMVISGGLRNRAQGAYSVIGGGHFNVTYNTPYSGVFSGYNNVAGNSADDSAAVVMGGRNNLSSGRYAVVGGGLSDTAAAYCSGVLSGYANRASDNADTAAVIAGGWQNTVGKFSFIGGGKSNTTWYYATVGGGDSNTASWSYSTVSGGRGNTATRDYATVGGGQNNNAYYSYTTVCGGRENRAQYDYGTVAGGYRDTVMGYYGGILSGYQNLAGDAYGDTSATVVGGWENAALAKWSFIGGGRRDTTLAFFGTCGGGYSNKVGSASTGQDTAATIAGGWNNTVTGKYGFVGGGRNNSVWMYGTIGGGLSNYAEDAYATVAGGYADTSSGSYSFTTNYNSIVPIGCQHAAAFNGQTATAMSQVRAYSFSSAMGAGFSIDHPLDPLNKILNHRGVESPEMVLLYRGVVFLDDYGRAEVMLPDYFDALNRDPMIQLTGVGTSDVYVAKEVVNNRFVIGGKPGAKVFWTVTGERKDQSAQIGQLLVPVEQTKEGVLRGRSLDDDGLAVTMAALEGYGYGNRYTFRTSTGRKKYEHLKQSDGQSKRQ